MEAPLVRRTLLVTSKLGQGFRVWTKEHRRYDPEVGLDSLQVYIYIGVRVKKKTTWYSSSNQTSKWLSFERYFNKIRFGDYRQIWWIGDAQHRDVDCWERRASIPFPLESWKWMTYCYTACAQQHVEVVAWVNVVKVEGGASASRLVQGPLFWPGHGRWHSRSVLQHLRLAR